MRVVLCGERNGGKTQDNILHSGYFDYFPHPRLRGGVFAIEFHGSDAKVIGKGVILDSATGSGDKAFVCGIIR